MRSLLLSSIAGALLMAGCHAAPGYRLLFEINKPPILRSPAPVSPVNAPPVSFAVEDVQAWPHYQRAPMTGVPQGGNAARSIITPADPCNPARTPVEPLPMPRAASTPREVRNDACQPE